MNETQQELYDVISNVDNADNVARMYGTKIETYEAFTIYVDTLIESLDTVLYDTFNEEGETGTSPVNGDDRLILLRALLELFDGNYEIVERD